MELYGGVKFEGIPDDIKEDMQRELNWLRCAGLEGIPDDFKECVQRELNWWRFPLADTPFFLPGLFFWRRQDDNPDPSLSYDNLMVRFAVLKMISHIPDIISLVQFWAATTSEGRILLTTRNQPFALGFSTDTSQRRNLCEYRMKSREYIFHGDEESGEEQLGLPGRVFLHKLPEYNPDVRNCTKEEYPQLDDTLRCQIEMFWGLPVFEHSSHTYVGVLEIANTYQIGHSDGYRENILHKMNDHFQEFGLQVFDGCENFESTSGQIETSEMGSSDWPSMHPEMAISEQEEENLLENNGENSVTAERNVTTVSRLAEMQDANMVTIKATFDGNPMIKFRLSLSSRFLELEQEVDKRLRLKAGSYNVSHKDEHNQSILIACDKDLQDCMSRCLDKTPVVLYVQLELKQPITNLNLAN